MQFAALFVTALLSRSASASILDVLAARQTNNTEEAYLNEVCFPNTTNPVPPCQEIINIQTECQPNGTTPIYLLAHAECMCGGSFFSDWIGCLNCDYVHGGRSQQIVDSFNNIITSASHLLCTGTPTASFAAIFSSLSVGAGSASGATALSDQFPSNTAISLYYTPTGVQGAGAITGSATAAFSVMSTSGASSSHQTASSAAKTTLTGTSSGATAAAGTGSSSGGSSASSSISKAGAAPTGVWMGALGVLAGGVMMAAL